MSFTSPKRHYMGMAHTSHALRQAHANDQELVRYARELAKTEERKDSSEGERSERAAPAPASAGALAARLDREGPSSS